MTINKFRKFIYNQHDVVCNQKYADNLPYSAHLSFVESQGKKFFHLLENNFVANHQNRFSFESSIQDIVKCALIAHDSIEDARMTYNDLVDKIPLGNIIASKMAADIVYCVTDEKGKSRKERKNDKYYKELQSNDLALFVKLSDLAANMLFSKLSNSSMYTKYKEEWPKFRERLYLFKFDEFFTYIDSI